MNRDLAIPVKPTIVASGEPVERVACFCVAHSSDRYRRHSPELAAYVVASQAAMKMRESFTASAYRETKATALDAFRAQTIIDSIDQTKAEDILDSLEKGT